MTATRFSTTSLTLATYLIGRGFSYRLVRDVDRRVGVWQFDRGEVLAAALRTFDEEGARVEPRAFHHGLTKVRSELLDYLEGTDGTSDPGTVDATPAVHSGPTR